MTNQDCNHEYSIDSSGQGTCMVCGHLQFEEEDNPFDRETCPECDEGCTSEELAQWGMCHDCENSMCEECGLFEGHEDRCSIGLYERLDNPD